MPPVDLKDFLVATTGASASFIGLLFVAISFVLTDGKDSQAINDTKRILAESSYAALLNIFFMSLFGLVADVNLAYPILIMAWAGLGTTAYFYGRGAKIDQNRSRLSFFCST